MTRKYQLDDSGRNYRIGSPEHRRHLLTEQVKVWVGGAVGAVFFWAFLYSAFAIGAAFDLQ